jgi:circadian clock protein KaiC
MGRAVAAARDRSPTGNAGELRGTLTQGLDSEARVPSGVPELDDLVGGGLPRHRTVLLCGDIGTGKTTFGLQFLMAGVTRDEAGVMVSVDEKPQHLIEDARRFGWDVAGAVARRRLTVLDASPLFMALRAKHVLDARHVASDLAQQVRQAAASRLVIDGVTSLAPAGVTAADADDFVRSLILSLEDNLGCTTVLTARTTAGAHPAAAGTSVERLVSGVIELKLAPVPDLEDVPGRFRGWRRRSLIVRKMRGAPAAIDEQPLDIVDGRGVVLHDPHSPIIPRCSPGHL